MPRGRKNMITDQKKVEQIKIAFDDREAASAIPGLLRLDPRVEAVQLTLEAGGYDVGGGVLVERKTARDFLAGMVDCRLSSDITRLSDAAGLAILLVEGDLFGSAEFEGSLGQEVRRSFISWMMLIRQVRLVQTADENQTAAWLVTLARHLQCGVKPPPLQAESNMSHRPTQMRFLRSIHKIGEGRARKLLSRFGSAIEAMNASEEDLVDVIGRKAARAMRQSLDAQVIRAAG